jgi:hypothetical protein
MQSPSGTRTARAERGPHSTAATRSSARSLRVGAISAWSIASV